MGVSFPTTFPANMGLSNGGNMNVGNLSGGTNFPGGTSGFSTQPANLMTQGASANFGTPTLPAAGFDMSSLLGSGAVPGMSDGFSPQPASGTGFDMSGALSDGFSTSPRGPVNFAPSPMPTAGQGSSFDMSSLGGDMSGASGMAAVPPQTPPPPGTGFDMSSLLGGNATQEAQGAAPQGMPGGIAPMFGQNLDIQA